MVFSSDRPESLSEAITAMSGLLLPGCHATGETTVLISLLD